MIVNNKLTCEVCDSQLVYVDTLLINNANYVVCRSIDCQRVMKQKSNLNQYQFKAHLNFNRKLISQRRAKDAEKAKYVTDVNNKAESELLRIKKIISQEYSDLASENTVYLTIPSANNVITHIDDSRIGKYTEHLKSILGEACEYTDASEVIYDEHHDAQRKHMLVEDKFTEISGLKALSDRMCCKCKGGCCASGKEHAYLSVFSMRKYMDKNPDLSINDILGQYVSNISDISIASSCINHTATGCTLTRELRSDICNGFYCESLKRHQKNIKSSDALMPVVVIQRSSTYWHRYDFGIKNDIVDVTIMTEIKDHNINWG